MVKHPSVQYPVQGETAATTKSKGETEIKRTTTRRRTNEDEPMAVMPASDTNGSGGSQRRTESSEPASAT